MKPTADLDVDENLWVPCEPGTLAAFAASDYRRRRNRMLGKVTGVSVLLLLGIVGYATVAPKHVPKVDPSQGKLLAGITCAEVHANEMAYRSGEIDQELKRKISAHLSECPLCRSLLQPIEQQAYRLDADDRLVASQPIARR